MEKIPEMVAPLQQILEAELKAGNFVAEVSTWPPKCMLLVILGRSFMTERERSPDVTFHEINDTHYWKAEYRYQNGTETLACRF